VDEGERGTGERCSNGGGKGPWKLPPKKKKKKKIAEKNWDNYIQKKSNFDSAGGGRGVLGSRRGEAGASNTSSYKKKREGKDIP